ncbi:MAG: hypothetical protein N2Z21_08020 [Candidatus Sumerlaeaceae bacterium]|nr:hypothetical protein [Candidatus Sumerlaeaceae bacterium]
MAPPEDYIRSLAYSTFARRLYLGIGAHARLLEFDPYTNDNQDILPAEFAHQQFVMQLAAAENWLFAYLAPAQATLVFDLAAGRRLVGEMAALDSRDILQTSRRRPSLLLAAGEKLLTFQGATCKTQAVADVGPGVRALAWGEHEVSPRSVLAVNNRGDLLRIDLATGRTMRTPLELPPQPLVLHNVACGPDGRIYTSGYVTGGVGIYDPTTGKWDLVEGIGQAECIIHDGHYIYFGVYPGAGIVRYDPGAPCDNNNPCELVRLTPWLQDRPYAMALHPASGTLFTGTVPTYGHLGGALAVYDFSTQETRLHLNLIAEQSIVSLLHNGDCLWGGSSISGGLGMAPTASSAVLFAFDGIEERLLFQMAPVPGARAITGLVRDSRGVIYGWAEGTLFAFCPESRRVQWQKTIFPQTFPADHYWRGIVMKSSLRERDTFYGAAWGTVFKFVPTVQQLTVIAKIPEVEVVAPATDGKLYVISGSELLAIETS